MVSVRVSCRGEEIDCDYFLLRGPIEAIHLNWSSTQCDRVPNRLPSTKSHNANRSRPLISSLPFCVSLRDCKRYSQLRTLSAQICLVVWFAWSVCDTAGFLLPHGHYTHWKKTEQFAFTYCFRASIESLKIVRKWKIIELLLLLHQHQHTIHTDIYIML